jgi:hypothetical protein
MHLPCSDIHLRICKEAMLVEPRYITGTPLATPPFIQRSEEAGMQGSFPFELQRSILATRSLVLRTGFNSVNDFLRRFFFVRLVKCVECWEGTRNVEEAYTCENNVLVIGRTCPRNRGSNLWTSPLRNYQIYLRLRSYIEQEKKREWAQETNMYAASGYREM